MLGAEPAQHLGHRHHPFGREDADELALCPGRVRERAEQVEDRARGQLDAGRGDVAGRAVVARRHQKADADLLQAALHDCHLAIDVDAERGQHVGRARFRRQRAVAVLGHRHAGTRPTTSAVAVETLKVPEPSPPVPHVSIVPGGAVIATAFDRMIRAAPVISSTVSPRTRSAISRAPICDGVALPT